ncbi:MAG: helix-turn-helix transcriptional regulator [Roseburia sp.]|nr:helix-turn-helix transcriptional regulator [Roseburia sp.]
MTNFKNCRSFIKRLYNKSGYTLLYYFLSYFLIFSVLFFGFFFIMRSQLSTLYYKQLTDQSSEHLTHVTEQLKEEINDLATINSSLRSNVNVVLSRYKSDAYYQYQAYQEIETHTIGRPFIDSLVFLNKNLDIVISSHQYVAYRDNVFYLHSADTKRNTFLFSPEDYISASHNQLIYLTEGKTNYLIYLPSTFAADNSMTFMILDSLEIKQLCDGIVSDAMPAIALVDADRRIVCGSNTDMLAPYMNSFDYAGGIYPLDDNNSLCVSTGINNGFIMLSLISNDALLKQVNIAFSHAYIVLLTLGSVGMLLVFFATRSTFMPLLRLTRKIVDKPDPSQNYFEQLDQAFENSVQQNRTLQEKLDNYKLSMQKSILDSIVSSNQPADAAALPDIDQFFNMDPNNYIFAVRMYAPQAPLPCNEILAFFRESLTAGDCCVILEKTEDTAVFLLNYAGTEQHKDEVLQFLLTNLHQEKGYWSAISNSSNSPMDIPSLYEHSIQASRLWDRVPVVSYHDITPAANAVSALSYPYETQSSLSAALRENNCKDASAHIKELFRIIDVSADSENELPDFFTRSILFDMLTTIANAMNDMNIRFNTYNDLYFETLYYCRSFPYTQNRETIQGNISRLLSFFEEQLDNKITTSYQLAQIMEECYTQPDFSVAVLADRFHVSIAYMSYLVKKETGEYFSDYLWALRMKKAKELLLTTRQSVDEISLAVGYVNTSSFRRKFKQETGLTPSQFRAGKPSAAPGETQESN